MRPERCWPLAVGVVRWTGTPRCRSGRGGEPELLRQRRIVSVQSAITHHFNGG